MTHPFFNHQHQVLQGYTYVGCGHLPVVIGLWIAVVMLLGRAGSRLDGWISCDCSAYALMCMVSPKLRWLGGLTVIAAGMLVCKNGPQSRSHLGRLPVLVGAACWVYGGMEAASEVLA